MADTERAELMRWRRLRAGTSSLLADLARTSSLLAGLALTSSLLARLTLTSSLLARLTLTSSLLARLTLTSSLLARLTLTSSLLARLTLTSSLLAGLTRTSLLLAGLARTNSLLAGLMLASGCGGSSTEGECDEAQEFVRACIESDVLRPPLRLPVPTSDACEQPERCFARCINATTCGALARLGAVTDPDQDPGDAPTLGACFADCDPCSDTFAAFRNAASKPCLSP